MRVDRGLVDGIGDIAIAAGAITLAHWGKVRAIAKDDGSPVTIADRDGEALVLERLHRLLPGVPVVSEEAMAQGRADHAADVFVLVDALDGTKEFLAGSDEFTVNIAVIQHGRPVAAALHAPATQRLWLAGAVAERCNVAAGARIGHAVNRRPIEVRKAPDAIVALTSLRHSTREADACRAHFRIREMRRAGSSLKFCLIAEGVADLYPRMGPTMEWDTAAGDAILTAAGGAVVRLDGEHLTYGREAENFRNPWFVAVGDRALLERAKMLGRA